MKINNIFSMAEYIADRGEENYGEKGLASRAVDQQFRFWRRNQQSRKARRPV